MKKTALVFSGQGSQYSGMGKMVYDNYKEARQIYEEAADILGFNISKLCFEGSRDDLISTKNTQIAILTTSIAMYKAYEYEIGLEPYCMAGHSLGEYSALVASGKLKFQDALKIVETRGKLMQDAVNDKGGCMSCIIGLDSHIVQNVCNKYCNRDSVVMISNYNSPKQSVISGNEEAVSSVCRELEEMGAKIIELEVRAPFHSILMKEAADKMAVYLGDFKFQDTKMPVISNVKAEPYNDTMEIYKLLPEQIVKPVRWNESMIFMEYMGVDTLIEIGPKSVLKKLTKHNCPYVDAYSYDIDEDVREIRKKAVSCYGAKKDEVDWNIFIEKCIASAISTKNRNWDEKEYDEGVVKPYRMIKEDYYLMKDNNEKATMEEAKKAYHMLSSVLATKKVSDDERNYIMNELFYGIYSNYVDDIAG